MPGSLFMVILSAESVLLMTKATVTCYIAYDRVVSPRPSRNREYQDSEARTLGCFYFSSFHNLLFCPSGLTSGRLCLKMLVCEQ
ncbi:hypothetical protein BX600DRAFT_197936 [Xylariales sp. PMI_506]|nr:hypothetical protein BX600DRAFT_197936 [Xylariales sp. PMI_506]